MTISNDAGLPSLARPDEDPWLWLEDVEGKRATSWADAESERTAASFKGAGFERDRAELLHIMDRPDKLPGIARRGEWVYSYWIDAQNPRGLWRRTTLEKYRSDAPNWEVVFDLDALAASEEEDWVWHGPKTLPGAHDRAILSLSRGGSDAVVMREYDIEARAFVEDGFALPETKGDAEWQDRDTLLVCAALGEGMATSSGYGRTIRRWRRGTPFADAETIFEVAEDHIAAACGVVTTDPQHPVELVDVIDFFNSRSYLLRDGEMQHIAVPDDAEVNTDGRSMVIKLRTAWTTGGETFVPDSVLIADLAAFMGGSQRVAPLFVPNERHGTTRAFWLGRDELMVATLENLRPVHTIWRREGESFHAHPVKGLPEIGTAYAWSFDQEPSEYRGDLLAVAQDPLTPPSQMLIEAGKAPVLLKRAPVDFAVEGLAVSQHEAISTDGTAIPYVQVGPQELPEEAPVHLTAYGGFGMPMLPHYDGGIGKLWLEKGGVHVTASIRGGGEFGTRWHDEGRLAAKKQSHDDFAAVAADLVKRGVTVPQRIAAEGGSNGGLLIANMLTRYPDRFGALFCTIPLIDMRRYTQLLAGASWIAEYGDPSKPEEWAFIREFSAYHAAKAGENYPPILLATARRDDRVHPGHARKMAAKLKALGYDAWLYEPAAGGHGYGKDNAERAVFGAVGYSFMRESIGWKV